MSQNQPDELREQVEFTKEFMEWVHGMALQNENIDKARAYYEAIDMVDAALDGEWALERAGWDERELETIEASREAREEGVAAATLHELSMERHHDRYGSRSLLDRLLSWVST